MKPFGIAPHDERPPFHYAADLFDFPPEGFSKSLTLDGLLSLGHQRCKQEWDAIANHLPAQMRLMAYLFRYPNLPDDGMKRRMRTGVINLLSGKA